MDLRNSILFYLVIGVAVAVAVYVRGDAPARWERLFRTATAVVFWPLYLTVLLNLPRERSPSRGAPQSADGPGRALWAGIEQVERELQAALRALEQTGFEVFQDERSRIEQLCAAWRTQADSICEMERLLASPGFVESTCLAGATPDGAAPGGRLQMWTAARAEHVAELRTLHDRSREELLGALAWVRELTAMLHLARYGGSSADRIRELLMQLAAAGAAAACEQAPGTPPAGGWPRFS